MKTMSAEAQELSDAIYNAAKDQTATISLSPVRICDYCGCAPAQGYVRSYDSHVCEECYEDHHGPTF